MTAALISSALLLNVTVPITTCIRLIQRRGVAVSFWTGFLPLDISVRGLTDLTGSILCGGNSFSAFFIRLTTSLSKTFLYYSILAFLSEHFSASVFRNMATGTVKVGSSTVRVTTSLTTCSFVRHFRTALSKMVWKGELRNALATNRLTTVQIIDITLLSGINSVALHAFKKSHTTASSSKTGIL